MGWRFRLVGCSRTTPSDTTTTTETTAATVSRSSRRRFVWRTTTEPRRVGATAERVAVPFVSHSNAYCAACPMLGSRAELTCSWFVVASWSAAFVRRSHPTRLPPNRAGVGITRRRRRGRTTMMRFRKTWCTSARECAECCTLRTYEFITENWRVFPGTHTGGEFAQSRRNDIDLHRYA